MNASIKFAIACWLVAVVFWTVSAFSVKKTKAHQPLAHRLLYLFLIALAAALLNGSARIIHWNGVLFHHTLATGIIGDALVLVGLVIAIWARATLGRNWSSRVTLKEQHELIKTGPYRLVRHPIYSGLLVMVLGTAVVAGQAAGFVALPLCACGCWVKLRQEEILLTRHLPGYSEYMRHTKALIPFLF